MNDLNKIIEKLQSELTDMTMRAIKAELERDMNDRLFVYESKENAKLKAEVEKLKKELEGATE